MVVITKWKVWINAYENLLTVEDYSDAQASSACSALIFSYFNIKTQKGTKQFRSYIVRYLLYVLMKVLKWNMLKLTDIVGNH